MGVSVSRETTRRNKKNKEYLQVYNCYRCVCAKQCCAVPKTLNSGNTARPTMNTLKTGCLIQITVAHHMLKGLSGHDKSIFVVSVCLEHTNGCIGNDPTILDAIKNRRGRNYSKFQMEYLRGEVNYGIYDTHNAMSWLVEQGLKYASLGEATNLRYPLMHDMPIKGWNI